FGGDGQWRLHWSNDFSNHNHVAFQHGEYADGTVRSRRLLILLCALLLGSAGLANAQISVVNSWSGQVSAAINALTVDTSGGTQTQANDVLVETSSGYSQVGCPSGWTTT